MFKFPGMPNQSMFKKALKNRLIRIQNNGIVSGKLNDSYDPGLLQQSGLDPEINLVKACYTCSFPGKN
jgi:hypothetical protein